jgi:hypothetical protein
MAVEMVHSMAVQRRMEILMDLMKEHQRQMGMLMDLKTEHLISKEIVKAVDRIKAS